MSCELNTEVISVYHRHCCGYNCAAAQKRLTSNSIHGSCGSDFHLRA